LKLFWVGNGVADLAVGIEAAGEEVVEQTGADLAKLGGYGFHLRNVLVDSIQDCRYAALFWFLSIRQRQSYQIFDGYSSNGRTNAQAIQVWSTKSEKANEKPKIEIFGQDERFYVLIYRGRSSSQRTSANRHSGAEERCVLGHERAGAAF
jgi:hypothetical protein